MPFPAGRRLRRFLVEFLLPLAACQVFGTAWHEIVGHGLTGVVCGGRITYVHVLGFRLWPNVAWEGWSGGYGYCDVKGIPTNTGEQLMNLGGSMSTWVVAVVAMIALWSRRWSGWPRTMLAWLSIWWIDLFTYTLPTFGIRRSIFWGRVYSEPYDAAVALGIPGWGFQIFALGSGVLLALLLVIRLRTDQTTTAASCEE